MKIFGVMAVAICLVGCSTAAAKAEQEYEFLNSNKASSAELCEAATKAKEAWAERKNQDRYELWQIKAKIDCLNAQMKS